MNIGVKGLCFHFPFIPCLLVHRHFLLQSPVEAQSRPLTKTDALVLSPELIDAISVSLGKFIQPQL